MDQYVQVFKNYTAKKTAFGKRNCVNLAPTQVADPTAMKVRQRAIISMKCECVHVIICSCINVYTMLYHTQRAYSIDLCRFSRSYD